MTTASNGFVMLENGLLNLGKVAGKTFTGNMKITYSLIQGFEKNGQIAYFSHSLLQTQLGASRSTVIRMLSDMVEMGLINKTEQVNGGTLNYTVNPITPEMVGTPEAAKPEVTKPTAAPQPKETVENAGTNQPGTVKCGSDSVHRSRPASPGASPVDHSGGAVRPAPVPVPVEQGAANDDLRNPVIDYVAGSNVMIVNGSPVEYLEPEESDIDQFGDAF
ncbi:helix-turn-helix domain-containing protein [Enterobacter hormaechei]|uniref:helix-turn-helix domain-containing protein n=1 Tax=Enterobacter hormaechei TaxID=158836 RepID=UPI00223F3B84|nr:helix-turn-helix domain-containing protein [Enterobacter hormaechei]